MRRITREPPPLQMEIVTGTRSPVRCVSPIEAPCVIPSRVVVEEALLGDTMTRAMDRVTMRTVVPQTVLSQTRASPLGDEGSLETRPLRHGKGVNVGVRAWIHTTDTPRVISVVACEIYVLDGVIERPTPTSLHGRHFPIFEEKACLEEVYQCRFSILIHINLK